MTDEIKLPLWFQFLMGLMFIGAFAGLAHGVINKEYVDLVYRLACIVFLFGFYKKQKWGWYGTLALFGLNILGSIAISVMQPQQAMMFIVSGAMSALLAFLFTRPFVKAWVSI